MAILTSTGLPLESMQLQVTMVNRTPPVTPVTIYPRYNNSTANTKTFSASGDYAPAAAVGGGNLAYHDFNLTNYCHTTNWYNYVHDNDAGRRNGTETAISDINRASIYAQIQVGDYPHPGVGASKTRLAMLYNQAGAYHALITTGSATPNYAEPRVLGGNTAAFENFQVSGQNYSQGSYGAWYCLANYIPNIVGSTHYIRIINLGGDVDARSKVIFNGLIIVLHGENGQSGQ